MSGEYSLVINLEKGMLMQSPVWILNSSLAIIFILNVGFIFLSRISVPKRFKVESAIVVKSVKREASKVDCTRIGTEDLFNTYVKSQAIKEEVKNLVPQIPQPPTPKPMPQLEEIKPQFLEPLPLKLKGILVSASDTIAQAIIANTKTFKEELFSSGDKIEDAYILRILPNKVILIRSNGQQETLYITQADAQSEITVLKGTSWGSVVNPISDYEYIVDPESFLSQITNLAQFIDAVDLATVFRKGQSLGCRVGRLSSGSIGEVLGLRSGDIITKINGIEPKDTNSRIEAYNNIKSLRVGDKIKVELLRDKRKINIVYYLQIIEPGPKIEIERPVTNANAGAQPAANKADMTENIESVENTAPDILPEEQKEHIEEQQMAFKKISRDMQRRDKQAMLNSAKYQRPGKGALLRHVQS